MDRLADYVQWMEDFPIEATGLRDADALVLCALSYFDLSPLFKGRRKTARIRDCVEPLERGELRGQTRALSSSSPRNRISASVREP